MSSDIARSHRANGSSSSSNHSRAGSGTRSSTARSHPQVESAVTRLLVAIKQLLESLTGWSVGKMTDGQVSDVYVQLGNDFNTCVTAFGAYDIDMRDLLTVPMALRTVLETALAEEPSPANLDVFLPEVRQIITDLLQGLRGKQSIFRQKVADRAQRRQDRQVSDTPRTSRSSSQPRPLPAPSIPEESGERTSPPPPPALPSIASQPPVASAIPERVSGGRRKYSHPPRSTGFSDSGQSEGEGSSSSKPRRGSTNRRLASSSSVGGGDDGGEGLADLAANANMAEERLASTERARRLPLPPSTTPTPAAGPEREDPFQPASTTSARSSATVTQPSGEKTPPQLPASAPALSPEIKRYSLVDRPLSPPTSSPPLIASGPVVNVESASPSPSSTTGSGFLNNLQSPDSPGLSAANNTPAVARELAELEQTDALQRKASKRFSTYTFSKMAGGAGLPALPALPMNGAAGSSNKPGFNKSINRRSIIASSASIANLTPKDLETLAEADEPMSPQKSPMGPVKALTRPADEQETSPAQPASTASEGGGPGHSRGISGRIKRETSPAFQKIPEDAEDAPKAAVPIVNGAAAAFSEEPESDTPSSTSGYITAYLQVGRSVKKVVIERHNGLSFASLRVLFVDKFSYSPGQENFPAIYIRDPKSDIQYELEDITEIKDGCLLSLNIEPLDQVKQHIDMQMASLSSDIKDLKAAFNSQRRMSATPMPVVIPPSANATPQQARPTEQQFQVLARRLSRYNGGTKVDEPPMPNGRFPAAAFGTPKMQPLIEQSTGGTFQGMYQTPVNGSYQSLVPQSTGGSSYTFVSDGGGMTTRIANDLKSQFDEVQGLRRDLGIMRQVYSDFMSQAKTAISSLRGQNELVKGLANSKIGGSRAYIDTGKAKLDTRSQNVLTKIEELQDLVEGLRDDVLKRHISPKSNLIKSLKADIEASQKELESLTAQISTVKPIWKKTWEEELQNIVEEQQFLAHQEEFIGDLIEDHKALTEVFGHVEKVITIRNNTMPSSGSGRGGRVMRTGRQFRPPPPEAGHDGLSTVMLEIRGAAMTDPTRRLKAIEANQKAREKERMARSDEFTEELSEFVDQKRLKMTGGIEEAERLRQLRSDHALKNMFSPAAGGVAGGTMVGASGGVGGFDASGFGDGGSMGMGGVTFAKAPSAPDDDDPFGPGGGGFGMGGFSFAKAPAIPDSP